MDQLWNAMIPLWQPLLLLLVANGAPILARELCGPRFNRPLDGGRTLADGRRLLGETKTWRGLAASLAATTLFAVVVGLSWWLGCLFALLALTGDALSSFIKRRLSIVAHGRAVGLDQVPESLLPLWALQEPLGLGATQLILAVALFVILELLLSPILYRWHVRLRPY
jgi:CDP-2,3-bis-(O-geranylgeranyl)-sn-glycerol synthase